MTAGAAPARVLVLGNLYPPHTLGGYELLCRDHVATLRAQGREVTVLATTYGVGAPLDERGVHGERVVRALRFQWHDFRLQRLAGVELWREERRQRRVLERVLGEARPEVAMVWHMAAVSKSLLAVLHRHRVPVLAIVGEPWPAWDIETDAWLSRWRRPAVRLWKRPVKAALRTVAGRLVAPVSADAALASMVPVYCSDHLRRHVEERVAALRGRGVVVHNGIDLGRFPPRVDAERPLRSPLRLLYLGRVERRKGVLTAVEAVSLLLGRGVGCVLRVVGWRDDAFVDEVRAVAVRLGVAAAVEWCDAVPRDRVPSLYDDHDVLLFPTIWEEPFGLVPLEAMAAGCLVVATGTGGSGEFLVDGQTALRFPPQDAEALARCVERLVHDPTLCARMRRAARACAEEHSLERFTADVDRLAALTVDSARPG